MKTQPYHFEILALLFLSVIPWPGPSVFKISCPRERASVVRRIVHKRWLPILKKYQVELPLECPFHESRDIFHPQQEAKHQHRSSQWTCGLCGKSFYAEKYLDAHFDNRHKHHVNTAEDAVCLADYCDIMRCDVLGTRDFENSLTDDDSGILNTDIQVWKENTERTSVVVPCKSQDIIRSYHHGSGDKPFIMSGSSRTGSSTGNTKSTFSTIQRYCQKRATANSIENNNRLSNSYHREIAGPDNKSSACDNDDDDDDDDDDEDDDELEEDDDDDIQYKSDDDRDNLVESALPAVDKKRRGRRLEIRKLKSHCKPEELQKLKLQCEILVRDCVAGLLTNLSVKDFQELEGELNRAICWYLSCDKYWEDTKRPQRQTPWYLLITFLVLLFSGIFACYYIIWILFNSTEDEKCLDGNTGSIDYNDGNGFTSSSTISYDGKLSDRRFKGAEITGELIPTCSDEMPDHYIYDAYPPELKRRLLERKN